MFVKFCGFTRTEDVEAACKLGVSACGFVFYPGSRRYCNYFTAKDCIAICKEYNVKTVGVFVDSVVHSIESIATVLQLDILQIYSHELYFKLSPFYTIFLCIRIGNDFSITDIPPIHKKDYYLFDTYDPHVFGGTGKQFNWDKLQQFDKLNQSIIAGGINCQLLPDLLATITPFGIDVSSGIEDKPGLKNVSKMEQLLTTIKELGYEISRL